MWEGGLHAAGASLVLSSVPRLLPHDCSSTVVHHGINEADLVNGGVKSSECSTFKTAQSISTLGVP